MAYFLILAWKMNPTPTHLASKIKCTFSVNVKCKVTFSANQSQILSARTPLCDKIHTYYTIHYSSGEHGKHALRKRKRKSIMWNKHSMKQQQQTDI